MRITAIEEYGLRCLVQLARKGEQRQMSIAEIARQEGISIPYASKLLAILRKAKLVVSARGRGGGFSISRPPSQITLFDVLVSLGGPLLESDHCQKYTGQMTECVHIENCSVLDIFGGLAGYIEQFLVETTLDELITKDRIKLIRHKAGIDALQLNYKQSDTDGSQYAGGNPVGRQINQTSRGRNV